MWSLHEGGKELKPLVFSNGKSQLDIVKETIGKNIPILGCYTFGEYAPSNADESKGQSYFNNHTVSVALFSE